MADIEPPKAEWNVPALRTNEEIEEAQQRAEMDKRRAEEAAIAAVQDAALAAVRAACDAERERNQVAYK